ncbi:ABC transporter substrate-binding protein [Kurthia sibirica]|nr:ABC transporter substrate-binding protein [Kurthia sibirica]
MNKNNGVKKSKTNEVMKVGYELDVTNFDPTLSGSGGDHVIQWPIYDTLIRFDDKLDPLPGLVREWQLINNKTIRLKLEENVKFHDGTSFNATAVKINIERMNSKESIIRDLQNIKLVHVMSDFLVELQLKKPDSSILMALSDRGGMMVSPKAIANKNHNLSENPVGTGPFKFESREPNAEIIYTKNHTYWSEKEAKVEKLIIKVMADENVRMNALRSGELDFIIGISPTNIASFEKNNNFNIVGDVASSFKVLFINADLGIMKNKDIRLAMQYAINRDQLVQALNFGRGKAGHQVFSEKHWAYIDDFEIPYNPQKAKEHIKKSGVTDLQMTFTYYSKSYETRLAELLRTQLEMVGFKVKLEGMETVAAVNYFFGEKRGEVLVAEWTGRTDAQMAMFSLFSRDSFFNTGGNSTDEIEQLINEGASTNNKNKRKLVYEKIQKKAYFEEAIIIPIIFPPAMVAYNKKVVGYEANIYGKVLFSQLGFK